MSLLPGFRVLQAGDALAAAVCGRLLADVGAEIACIDPDLSTPLSRHLNRGKTLVSGPAACQDALTASDLIVCAGTPREIGRRGWDAPTLRRANPAAPIIYIAPFGQKGPHAENPATDLTLLYASGIARMLTGQVDDLSEPPIRAVGEQSAFIGGLAAACAGMHAALHPAAAVIDVSMQEALATLAITELARAGMGKTSFSRRRVADGNGATVTILPAVDGFVAISPREDGQWQAWLAVMGSPDWSSDPRFATKPDRVTNWDMLHALMSDWSRQHTRQWIADAAQAAHVPSFPLGEPSEQFASPQLAHRRFWRSVETGGRSFRVPGPPFGITLTNPPRPADTAPAPGPLPLSGVRVLDFSWVIAGPTATRYLAAMGAEVIKVEAPGRGDPGRASELHTVLGQGKRGIVLDLKQRGGMEIARRLAGRCDVLIENFATGVMDRLGLGVAELRAINPNLIYVSASGLGRTGPEAQAVAYGTLLQCYAGFAGLNRHPGRTPRVGMAWLDPMCGLMLALIVAAALWRRTRTGAAARVDFSMVEAMLWTMAEPLLEAQGGVPAEYSRNRNVPLGSYRCRGDDEWLALAVEDDAEWRRLCAIIPGLGGLAGLTVQGRIATVADIDAAIGAWARAQDSETAAAELLRAGIRAGALAHAAGLVADTHLCQRGFWRPHGTGVLPGLPWNASFGQRGNAAPGLGADTKDVLRSVLEMPEQEIVELCAGGTVG
jgi:crotonobetainyl-CoA:carnitine CoA-transferase CaiB-like acyl-CoA transferase